MSLSQQAYGIIKRKIISLEYAPNDVLNENELREALELGRTPIREALQQLERDNLVKVLPRKGILVSDIDLGALSQIHEVRRPLELISVELATKRGTKEIWDEMQACLSRISAESSPTLTDNDLLAIDEQCHILTHQAADNPFIKDTLEVLYTHALRLWYYSLPKIKDLRSAVLEHQAMLDAMKVGDAKTACNLMESHINAFHNEISSAIQNKLNLGNPPS